MNGNNPTFRASGLKCFLVVLLLGLPLTVGWAQTGTTYLAGQRQPTEITLMPSYQQYDNDGMQLSQFSIPVAAFFSLGRSVGLSVQASQASASADGFTTLSGLTDVQATATYFIPIGEGSVVVGLGLNLPSGKQELTDPEFNTLLLVSRNVFDFRVPSLGRGLGIAPNVTWAQPLGETFVIGLGVAYQYRAAYKPLANMTDSFDPGDELLLTGGFDTRLGEQATLSGDVTYTLYQTDTLGDEEVFDVGDQVVVSTQFRQPLGDNEAVLHARYRSRSKNSLAAGGTLVEEDEKTDPSQFEVMGRYRQRLSRSFWAGAHAQARVFQETPAFPQANVFGAGASVEYSFSPEVRMPLRFTYLLGDLTGFEAIAGLILNF